MIQSEKNLSIAPYTHYKIGGIAREVYFPADASELLGLLRECTKNGTDFYILGGGSNVLVGDGYFDAYLGKPGRRYYEGTRPWLVELFDQSGQKGGPSLFHYDSDR